MSKSLRLCLVAPSERLIGGHSVQASQLRRGLAGTGAVSVTAVDSDSPLPAWFGPVDKVRFLRTLLRLAFFVPRLARAMRATDVTHVFAAAYWSFAMTAGVAVALGRLLRRPVIVNYHAGEAADHLRRHPGIVRWVLRHAQRLVVPSAYLVEVFEGRGYATAKIPNAIDLDRFAPRPRRAPFLRFLCTRSLEPGYDIATAIRAFGLILSAEPRAVLTIVGGGSEAEALRRLVRELNLEDRVRLVGSVPHREIARFYRAADLYLNPAVIDNQPLSVLEAMAAGLFVVSTKVGDLRDLIGEGRGGVLVGPGSPAAMAAAAGRVIHDGPRFAAATEAARAALLEHAPTQVARRWVACYRDVTEESAVARVGARRPGAWLLRIRQELAKRVDALLPRRRWRGLRDTLRLLRPDVPAAWDESLLLAGFARRAATRYPSRHLDRRDPALAPDGSEIVEEARRLCTGPWQLFGSVFGGFPAAPEWRAHPVSGRATPAAHWSRIRYLRGQCGGDVKFIWELNRHGELVRLAQAFYLTRSHEYADRLKELLTSWLRQNPPGIGVNWTSSLEVAIRAIAWCWIWHLTKDAKMWTGPLFAEFLWQLWHHARHVERFDSTHHSPNTHLTGEALGLLYVGTLFPEFKGARRWRERGATLLRGELDRQVLADGMHCERSACYHRYTLEIYLHAWLLGAGGRRARGRVHRALQRLLTATARLSRPDGSWPLLGDEDGGRVLRLGALEPIDQRPLVLAAGVALRRTAAVDCRDVRVRAEAWWLLDEAAYSRVARSAPAAARSAVLRSAGYYVGRDDGGDPWYCLVVGGSPRRGLAGHSHADLGHVEIARGTRRIVSDPGCSTYTTDLALRNWFRSEEAHACLSVEGLPLAEPGGAFSWRRLTPTPHAASWDAGVAWVCEVAYVRGDGVDAMHHRRQVALVRDCGVLICDWLAGGGVRRVTWRWPLPLAPNAVALTDDGASLDGVAVRWWVGPRSGRPEVTVAPSPFAPTYGRLSPGSQLAVQCTAELPLVLLTGFTSDPDRCRCLAADARHLVVEWESGDGGGGHALEFRAHDRPVVRRVLSREVGLTRPRPLSLV